jgi:hypothetical protein
MERRRPELLVSPPRTAVEHHSPTVRRRDDGALSMSNVEDLDAHLITPVPEDPFPLAVVPAPMGFYPFGFSKRAYRLHILHPIHWLYW